MRTFDQIAEDLLTGDPSVELCPACGAACVCPDCHGITICTCIDPEPEEE